MSAAAQENRKEFVHLDTQALCEGFGKVSSRFVNDVIQGISKARSVRLTEIGRALNEEIPLHATQKRLSRNLADESLAPLLSDRLLQLGAKNVHENTRIVVTQSSLTKRYAQKMQYLSEVQDDNRGIASRGYRICEITGSDTRSGRMTPLAMSLWSPNAPDFDSDANQVLSLVQTVRRATRGNGILVVNAGLGDHIELLQPWTDDNTCRYIVRLHGERQLLYRKQPCLAEDLARDCETPYGMSIFKNVNDDKTFFFIHYGFVSVRLPECPTRPLWLVVVKTLQLAGKTGDSRVGATFLLLTTEPMRRNRKILLDIVEAYLTRWQVAFTNRTIRAKLQFNDIRVLTYERLRNMAALLQATNFVYSGADGIRMVDTGTFFHRHIHVPFVRKPTATQTRSAPTTGDIKSPVAFSFPSVPT